MNTMPDDTTLARWLDDDLESAEGAAFEAAAHPDATLLARRQAQREWRASLAAAIPAVIEPAYPEFFNHRIAKSIRELAPVTPAAPPKVLSWLGWWRSAAALAGMALAFWLGAVTGAGPQALTPANPVPAALAAVAPTVYTPEHGVDAEWFASPDAAATVIVLEGVDAIPDTLDFSESVGWHGNAKATAALAPHATAEVTQ